MAHLHTRYSRLKKNYANRSSRTLDITVIKIAYPFNNISIEHFAKKITLENVDYPTV